MKALVYQGPKTLLMETRAELEDTSDEVVIDLALCGICGSDMHAFLGHDARRPAPLILGHEAAGIERATGRRVTINPLQSCGKCDACLRGHPHICPHRAIASMPPREGAFAGSMLARPENLVEVHGARDIWIAETNPVRQKTLEAAGDFKIYDPTKSTGPGENSAQLVIDAVGIDPTRASATALARPGGAVVHIGLGDGTAGLDIRRMTLQEISFTGSYTYTLEDYRETAQAIFEGRFGALDWMEMRPLEEGQAAFDDILAGKVAAPKIILTT